MLIEPLGARPSPMTSAALWRGGWRAKPQAKCCSMPARAAAMPPMPRSTRSCRSGVFVPRDARDDVAAAIAIARDLKVPVLPRGAGTSQCGQTTGAALVIDTSKYLRRILDVDVEARTAKVEPGLVLDHLNAALKPHGLWYPVDVSTSAQATLGGMAGNNSCGSRSIAYGNMVHNVLGATPGCRTAAKLAFGPVAGLRRAGARRSPILCAIWRASIAREIEARWPKVLRRVAGYNLDIFDNQSERPYTNDGSVNLAHLLVGSEGTLAFTKRPDAEAGAAARRQGAGRGQFPQLPCRDGCGPAYRQARAPARWSWWTAS